MNRQEYYALCEIVQSLVSDQFSNQAQYAHAIHEIFKAFEAQNINFWDEDSPNEVQESFYHDRHKHRWEGEQ